jgi:hypothetical protein
VILQNTIFCCIVQTAIAFEGALVKKIPGAVQSSRMIQGCMQAQAVEDMRALSVPDAVVALDKEIHFKTNFQE